MIHVSDDETADVTRADRQQCSPSVAATDHKLIVQREMRRQFGIRRFLANIAVLCAFLAFITKYPYESRRLSLVVTLYAPAILIAALSIVASDSRLRTFIVAAIGAGAGRLLAFQAFEANTMPLKYLSYHPTAWESFLHQLQTIGMYTAGGLLLAVWMEWVGLGVYRRLNRNRS